MGSSRRQGALAGLCAAVVLGAAGASHAAPRTEILLGEPLAYPENIASIPDGTVYMGSLTKPTIYRALPHATTATPWIHLSGEGVITSLGVLADAKSNTLWVCALQAAPDAKTPGPRSTLRSFNLTTGDPTGSYPLPGERTVCNDIAVAPNGAVYANDSPNARLLRLNRKTGTLEIWLEEKPALDGIDGTTFLGNTLYVNSVVSGHVYRVPIGADGKPGALVDIKLSQPLDHPDGMRAARGMVFVAENHGDRVSMLKFKGDTATVTVLKEGLMTPTGMTPTGNVLWINESRMNYLRDPALKGKDPGQIKAIAIPMPR